MLERKEIFINDVIRKVIRQISVELGENIIYLPLDDIDIYLEMLSRLVSSLAALESVEG